MNIKILSMLVCCSVMMPVEAPSFLDRCSSSLNDLYDMGAKLAKTGVIAILILAVLPADANHVPPLSSLQNNVDSAAIPVNNCTYYREYLKDNPIAERFLNNVSVNAGCQLPQYSGNCGLSLPYQMFYCSSTPGISAPINLSNKSIGILDAEALVPALLQLSCDSGLGLCVDLSYNTAEGIKKLVQAMPHIGADTLNYPGYINLAF